MTRLRHLAIATASGLALTLGVVGCAHERPAGVSGAAAMVASGNKNLSFQAPSDGQVTVYDTVADRVDYSGKINKGQGLMVDAPHDAITIDGRIVQHSGFDALHNHEIYFEPSSHVEKSSTVETNTNSVETSHGEH